MELRSKSSALSRLVSGLKRERHDYHPSLEVFPLLNVDKIAADMGLARIGAKRGAGGEPATDSPPLTTLKLELSNGSRRRITLRMERCLTRYALTKSG
jgi:hypothetical protein